MAEFSNINSKHSATTLTPFFANCGFHLHMSLLPPSPASCAPAADSYGQRLPEAQYIVQRELLKARKAMEVFANQRRRPTPNLVPSKKMWLLCCNVTTTRPSSKSDIRRLDPFPIISQIGSLSYRLELPPSMHIHTVLHVSLLNPHVANTFPGRVVEVPLSIHADGQPEFEVDYILDSIFEAASFIIRYIMWDTTPLKDPKSLSPTYRMPF